jgi:hypothetical protein
MSFLFIGNVVSVQSGGTPWNVETPAFAGNRTAEPWTHSLVTFPQQQKAGTSVTSPSLMMKDLLTIWADDHTSTLFNITYKQLPISFMSIFFFVHPNRKTFFSSPQIGMLK